MSENFTVKREERCNCSPETCCCGDHGWTVMRNEKGYVWAATEDKANRIAKALNPPKAKPLVWEFFDGCWISGPYKIDKNRWTFDSSETHITPVQNGFYIDIAAQKAACEAHHQARWLEQMA